MEHKGQEKLPYLKFEDLITTPINERKAEYKTVARRITFADGESVSVQVGEGMYCAPRNNKGPWDFVELGFPSIRPTEEIMKYAEDAGEDTNTVYGFVPVELVRNMIEEHGGEKE